MCFFHYLKSVCSVHSGLRDQIDRLKETLGGKVQSSGKAEDEKELDVRLAAIKVLISVSVFVAILVEMSRRRLRPNTRRIRSPNGKGGMVL